MDKLDLIIRDKQIELQGLQAELREALTGIESPDYEAAARVRPIIYGVNAELRRLEKLRRVSNPPEDFHSYLSRLLTDDTLTTLELWTQIKDDWDDVTFRILEIRQLKTNGTIRCTLQLNEAAERHLYGDDTIVELQHLGWNARKNGRTFWFKTKIKSPDQFDTFCQKLSITVLEALANLWKHGLQHYQFR